MVAGMGAAGVSVFLVTNTNQPAHDALLLRVLGTGLRQAHCLKQQTYWKEGKPVLPHVDGIRDMQKHVEALRNLNIATKSQLRLLSQVATAVDQSGL